MRLNLGRLIVYSTVHALYQERYAFRESMTDVVVQHLITEQKVRIRCKDYVKKIAVYKDRLAVQLPERVLIYSLSGPPEDAHDMQYRVTTRIGAKLECNLLVVTSEHVILCLEKKLQLYNLDGEKEREWVLEAVIRYIKVVGGPPGREGLLVGLKNGAIMQVLVDNPFLTQLIKHRASIRCLDLSAERRKLAVVDESAAVVVYDLATKGVIFEDANANSVAWNGDMESMLCYSGNGQLSIKTGDFPVTVQKLQGFVVGFQASKVFCLHLLAMQTIDVPQSSSMHNYLTRGDLPAAYKVACLGVTDSDWRALAMAALTSANLDIAKKALIRLRDVRLLDLLHSKQVGVKGGALEGSQLFLAEVLAFQVSGGPLWKRQNDLDRGLTMPFQWVGGLDGWKSSEVDGRVFGKRSCRFRVRKCGT
jgi:intraflagellar transport protein 122